jgi:Flp pilus assembly protein TadD
MKKLNLKKYYGKLSRRGVGIAVIALIVLIVVLVPYLYRRYSTRWQQKTMLKSQELIGDKKYSEAQKLLLQLADSPKASASVWSELGFTYLQEEKYPEAIEAYAKAGTYSKDSQTLNTLANAYRDNGQFAEAEAAYLEAIALNPNVSLSIVNLTYMYMQQQQTDKAKSLLERHINGNDQRKDLMTLYEKLFKK